MALNTIWECLRLLNNFDTTSPQEPVPISSIMNSNLSWLLGFHFFFKNDLPTDEKVPKNSNVWSRYSNPLLVRKDRWWPTGSLDFRCSFTAKPNVVRSHSADSACTSRRKQGTWPSNCIVPGAGDEGGIAAASPDPKFLIPDVDGADVLRSVIDVAPSGYGEISSPCRYPPPHEPGHVNIVLSQTWPIWNEQWPYVESRDQSHEYFLKINKGNTKAKCSIQHVHLQHKTRFN